MSGGVRTAEPGAAAAPATTRRAGRPDRVVVDGLTKRFPVRRTWKEILRDPFGGGKVTVLDDVSFTVGRGEFFGLLGPNGAGKTTLFKILATLVVPDGGRALVEGFDVQDDGSEVRSRLACVLSDGRSLYWRLDARQNLELFADLQGLPRSEVPSRVRSLLETVGLEDTGDKMVGDFSSGMQQRLLLARALLGDPEVLLLDEPTRSLDPLAARDFRSFLREEIAGRRGCTILLATHDSDEAFGLCDRVGVLHEGRLLAAGAAADLGERYGEEKYRLWVRDVEDERLDWMVRQGLVSEWRREGTGREGWNELTLALPGGLDGAADVVSSLTMGGATVARFERVGVPLADLLERIMAHREEDRP